MKIFIILSLILISCLNCFANARAVPMDEDDILKMWSTIKSKLAEENNVIPYDGFNELEAVELIPMFVKLYKSNKITENDEVVLMEIYGSLWPIILEEAKRRLNQDMSPFMKSLSKTIDLIRDIQNEVNIETRPAFDVSSEDKLSQRILKTAAMLIHHLNKNENARSTNNKSAKKTLKSQTKFNLRIRSRSKRNMEIDDLDSYYEDGELLNKNKDYMYDETYEDDEADNSSNFGSFQDLFLQAAMNRLRKEREETKLNKKRE